MFKQSLPAGSAGLRRQLKRFATGLVLALSTGLFALSAIAGVIGTTSSTESSTPVATPNADSEHPDASGAASAIQRLDEHPYSADPAFASGRYITDPFASNLNQPNRYFEGRKVVRLDNGEVIVAALVKHPVGNQTNGRWNIGLVRYNANGGRLWWSNRNSPYAHNDGEYIVYPNTVDANYSWIQDIVSVDNRILVAVNYHFNGSDDIDTYLLVFGMDGSLLSRQAVFTTGMAEYVGGMAAYPNGIGLRPSVVMVATRAPRESVGGGAGRPIFRRLTLQTDGTLTPATDVIDLNTHWCAPTTTDCRPAGITLAWRGLGIGVPPAIYVVNRAFNAAGGAGWGMAVTKINSSGAADSGWASAWSQAYDSGNALNWPVALAVRTTGLGTVANPYRDTVFVASEIERRCRNGVVVTRYNPDGTVPTGGHTVFGGSAASGLLCQAIGPQTDWPVDMAINGARLAVVGFGRYSQPVIGGTSDVFNGFVAILDAGTPNIVPLLDFRDYRYPINPGSAEFRHTGLHGITPGAGNKFVVVGDARFSNAETVPPGQRGKTTVATLGIAPDRIFGNGFTGQ